MNNNTTLSLEIITQSQLMIESLEQFQRSSGYRHKKVNLIKSLIQELEKDTVNSIKEAYKLDQETLLTVQRNYEYAVKAFAVRDIPNKVVMAQLLASYHADPVQMESTSHRILKKASNK